MARDFLTALHEVLDASSPMPVATVQESMIADIRYLAEQIAATVRVYAMPYVTRSYVAIRLDGVYTLSLGIMSRTSTPITSSLRYTATVRRDDLDVWYMTTADYDVLVNNVAQKVADIVYRSVVPQRVPDEPEPIPQRERVIDLSED